jgi:hypothetical protein
VEVGAIRSVEVDGDELLIRPWIRRKRIALNSIRRIESLKRDMLTHEENYLLLTLEDGRVFPLGELDRGFSAAETKLRAIFSPFDPHWMAVLEGAQAGLRQLIWERNG